MGLHVHDVRDTWPVYLTTQHVCESIFQDPSFSDVIFKSVLHVHGYVRHVSYTFDLFTGSSNMYSHTCTAQLYWNILSHMHHPIQMHTCIEIYFQTCINALKYASTLALPNIHSHSLMYKSPHAFMYWNLNRHMHYQIYIHTCIEICFHKYIDIYIHTGI